MEPDTYHTTLRRFAVLGFCIDNAYQGYVFQHDVQRPRSVNYAPHPHSLYVAFAVQLVLQAWWLFKLYSPGTRQGFEGDGEEGALANGGKCEHGSDLIPTGHIDLRGADHEPLRWDFLPMFVLGSSCHIGWSFCWSYEEYTLCRLFLCISAVAQLYSMFAILNGSKNRGFPQRNIMTHLVVKCRTTFVILLLWKTWGALDPMPPPNVAQQLNNLSFFLILAMCSGPDPTMGFLLVLVLFSLGIGPFQAPGWHQTFVWMGWVVLCVVMIDWLVAAWAKDSDGDSDSDLSLRSSNENLPSLASKSLIGSY
ncbi:hypothetical protein FA15DRAFT_705209 [Coprinopsis marcescibilis]|uniref:Uncharacterized protein n=1 Tax=Coprinopsis marcescibilis TaxID=230819 RepID=A0A5C3KV57_COPMA|nr:hypothetical protein FA15DRAFT_705209 [Coprinopsis marcescibilis]